MKIEENIKQRIKWLRKRIGLTSREEELITFQMKELAKQLNIPVVVRQSEQLKEWYAVHSGAEKLDIGTKEVLAYVKYESHAKELIKKYGGYGYYEKVNL